METYADDRLLDDGGKWSVRDCLSHVASSSRVSGAGQRALERLSGRASAPTSGAPSIDERNAQQVAERTGKSIAELIAEIKENHRLAQVDIAAMDDAALDQKIPATLPNGPATSVGGVILRMLEYHEGGQMDRIENALRARTRWV